MDGRMWYTADIQGPFSLREKCRPGKCTFFYLFFQFTMIPETTKDPGSICTIASAFRVFLIYIILLIYMILLVTFIQSINANLKLSHCTKPHLALLFSQVYRHTLLYSAKFRDILRYFNQIALHSSSNK